jgi:hypothetical protein
VSPKHVRQKRKISYWLVHCVGYCTSISAELLTAVICPIFKKLGNNGCSSYAFLSSFPGSFLFLRQLFFARLWTEWNDQGEREKKSPVKTLINIDYAVVFRRVCKICEKRLLASCPSVRLSAVGSHWTDFHDIWYFSIFRKSVEKIQILLKSDKNNRHYTWRPVYIFYHISLSYS